MPTILTEYPGELRTRAVHIKSGHDLITDAPVDNEGRGETFSPTDLLAASLASCMLTVIGIAARKHGFSIDGTSVHTTKIMASDPRRVSELIVEFSFPKNNYSEKEKLLIKRTAEACPVAKSLHPDLKVIISYNLD
jgi:putative redox protein